MYRRAILKSFAPFGAAIVLALAIAPSASAQETGSAAMPEMPMMQGGMGPGGMMGMGGPGMMGQGSGGMGMMSGGMGMCPGMMGSGMGGMGMMGGGMGMGGGMMGMGPMAMLNLSDEQRAKLNKIQDGLRKQHWETMGKMMDEQAGLRDLHDADAPDAKKIGAVYERIQALQRQNMVASIEAQNKMRAVLTKEQQEQLKQMRRGGMPMGGPGMMMGPRGQMGPGMPMPNR